MSKEIQGQECKEEVVEYYPSVKYAKKKGELEKMMEEAPSRPQSCCQDVNRRRRRRQEPCVKKIGLGLLLLSTLLSASAASSAASQLRGRKKKVIRRDLFHGLPQHGAQRPSIPHQHDRDRHDEKLRKLILIASSSRNHPDDSEREEARRRLVNILDNSSSGAGGENTDGEKQNARELQTSTANTRNKLTPQQRARIKKMNAERKRENAIHRKKKEQEQQTDGKFTFSSKPQEIPPKPSTVSSGSFSAYTEGKSMADSFVDSMASSFVNGGVGGESGSDEGGDIVESYEEVYTISQGSIVPSLRDRETLIDGFEKQSKLNWSFSEIYPWKVTENTSYEGKSSVKSGVPSSAGNTLNGKSIYSNLTLSLDNDYVHQVVGKSGGGAVLTFQVKASEALSWPISAFMVAINDEIVLSPSDVESMASSSWKQNKWAEFSVVIDTASSTNHDIKFIHVANPLKLDKLPKVSAALEIYMDNLRLAPFTAMGEKLEMTTTGTNGAKWKDASGTMTVTTKSVTGDSGDVDLTFAVYSKRGGTLKYELSTSTHAPHDDLALLLNGNLYDAVFGETVSAEWTEVEIPRGKQVITFSHRKNPGHLGEKVMKGLGTVKTRGENRVMNIEFRVGDIKSE